MFLVGHRLFEMSSVGKKFKQFESEVLQTMLGISHQPDFLPIIVNISPNRPPNSPTNRALLDTLIRKLDAMQVRAIGVDVDFSPLDNGKPVTPDDWNYFHNWLELANHSGLKLRLGVYRRATDPSQHWLGLQEFAPLAAGIATPSDDSEHNFFFITSRQNKGDGTGRLFPMSVALYEDTGGEGKAISKRIVREDENKGRLRTGRYRIDYSDSMLQALAGQTVDYGRPEDLEIAEATRRIEFRGKVVLIGDSTGFEDQFCRPFASAPTAGVIAHAASLVTLRQGGLQEIDDEGTVLLDLATLVVGCGLLLTFHFWRGRSTAYQSPNHVSIAETSGREETTISDFEEPGDPITIQQTGAASGNANEQLDMLETIYCIVVAFLIGAVGLLVVMTNHIFWPDFLWVSASLFVHPFVSETLFPFFGGIAGEISRMLSRTFSPKGASHAR